MWRQFPDFLEDPPLAALQGSRERWVPGTLDLDLWSITGEARALLAQFPFPHNLRVLLQNEERKHLLPLAPQGLGEMRSVVLGQKMAQRKDPVNDGATAAFLAR